MLWWWRSLEASSLYSGGVRESEALLDMMQLARVCLLIGLLECLAGGKGYYFLMCSARSSAPSCGEVTHVLSVSLCLLVQVWQGVSVKV